MRPMTLNIPGPSIFQTAYMEEVLVPCTLITFLVISPLESDCQGWMMYLRITSL